METHHEESRAGQTDQLAEGRQKSVKPRDTTEEGRNFLCVRPRCDLFEENTVLVWYYKYEFAFYVISSGVRLNNAKILITATFDG